ncbi:MAG: hypothetical protein KAW02_05635 [candidate division Zixibacteria bacterium]|nr:hypothetical protein [candidate division Zixibacteria bacterium]
MGYRPTLDDAKDFVTKIAREIDPAVECIFPDESGEEWFWRDVLLVRFRRNSKMTKEATEISIEDVVFDIERHDHTKQKIRLAIAALGSKS